MDMDAACRAGRDCVIFFCAAEYGEGERFDMSLFTDDPVTHERDYSDNLINLTGKACCTSTPSNVHTPK